MRRRSLTNWTDYFKVLSITIKEGLKMCKLYVELQKVAGWIKVGNESFISDCVKECDTTIKDMLEEGKQAEVLDILLLAANRMPREMGFYVGRSCIARGL